MPHITAYALPTHFQLCPKPPPAQGFFLHEIRHDLPRETKHTEHEKQGTEKGIKKKTLYQRQHDKTARSKTQAGTHTIKKAPQYAELSE